MSTPKKDEVVVDLLFGDGLGTEMVDILVGPEKKLFRVHKDLLCAQAPFFAKMFNGAFKEASEQQAELPEDSCTAFSFFLEYLYTSRLNPAKHKRNFSWDVISLHCFAEKYCLSELMDYSISAYLLYAREAQILATCSQMKYAYEHSSAGSHIRRFMALCLQFVATMPLGGNWKSEDLCELMADCKDLAFDFIKLSRNSGGKVLQSPRQIDPCTFHVHEKKGECSVKNDPGLHRCGGK